MLATMNQIVNLLSGFQTQFPPTNNLLRTSTNPMTQATIQSGQITTESVHRRASGNKGKQIATGSQGKLVTCYNCRGQGHIARECKEKKQEKDSQWFKDKALLMEAKEKGVVLDAEAEAFLADVECTAHYDNSLAITTTTTFKEEQLDFDVDSDIDDYDNIISYHQYQSNIEVKNVPTEVSLVLSDQISMITILDDMRLKREGYMNTNKEQSLGNDSLKAELERYKTQVQNLEQKLYKSKAGSNSSVSSGAIIPVKSKAVASGLYVMTPKYIPPQKRINRETNSSLPRKETVTVVDLSNVLVNLPTGIKSFPDASKSKSKSDKKIHKNFPARSKKVKRDAKPPRNLNKKNRVDSSLNDKCIGFISKSVSVCKTCNKCLIFGNHDEFVVKSMNEEKPRAFSMSLTGSASHWLRNKPSSSIITWEDLKTMFLSKYCLPSRTAKKMEEINNFQQKPDDTLYQVWDRFKELLMKCPQHYLMEIQKVILFYNRLDVHTRQILDSIGAIPSKIAANAKISIQEMVEYSQKWHNGTSRTRSTETFNGLAAIQAQLNNLGREINKVNEKVYAAQVGCEQCKGPHYTKISHSKKRVKLSNKRTTLNLVDLSKERDIEQQLQDSTRGTMQALYTKNRGNLWKKP
nr:hypothetical protein [Tanacetum cinerariifolium]